MRILKKIILFFLIISTLLLVVNGWNILAGNSYDISPGETLHERYDPSLIRLNSLKKMENYVDSMYASQKKTATGLDTVAYTEVCRIAVQDRFYHGVSEYNWSNNWMAWLGGTLIWSHIKAIVLPDDILKYSYAMCSQQQIVFLGLLHRKKISFRPVGLGYLEGPGHYISEVFYHHSWHMYDVDLEPSWEKEGIQHACIDSIFHHPELFCRLYENKLPREKALKLISRVIHEEKDKLPAQNMQLLHQVCMALILLIPLLLFYLYKKI